MTLPDVAQRKLQQLSQQASDAMALRDTAKKQTGDVEHRAQLLINSKASEADVAKALAAVEAAQDLQQERWKRWQADEELVTRAQSWVRELPRNTVLETVPAPTVAMNGLPAVVVGGLRSQISALVIEHHSIRTAAAPLDDAKAQVRALVARLGAKGRPVIRTQFGEVHVHGWQSDEQYGPTFHDMTIATLCWLDPDRVIAKLDEALEALPHSTDALPVSERASRLAMIEAEIALLESREEAVIEHAAKDGIIIERRFDQSPASILGVRIATTATARAA